MAEEILVDHKLKDGTVVLARERQEEVNLLHFRVRMNTRHPADVIFEQLVLGLTDSDKSWLWPNTYENTPEPLAGEPQVGCIIRMTYRVPRFDKPEIPAKPITYSYEWPQYDPESRLLEYRSLDHPLQGGAIVQVLPLAGGRSRIQWDGAYRQDPSQTVVVKSMINYIPFLYDLIEEQIEAGPARLSK